MADLKNIGRYEVKSEIARGGMATVYHAYDPRFERDVAIKVLPHAFLHDPQFRTRFEREAKMIALLEHPAIVPVYDFGEEDGQPYIVMRYMSGGSLNERIQKGSLPLLETARMIVRLAPALDAAHARNIIHRDLKPGNILFDQYGNAYLSDFGIARLAAAGSATLTGETIIGTPTYMSPEQVQGEKTIDGRSDVYSLGVLVYQMLTGNAPYVADTPAKVMMMHVLQPPPHILEAQPDLPDDCEALIEKAMSKSPDDRYSTAGELATELEAIARNATGAPPLSSSIAAQLASEAARPDHQMPTVASPLKTVAAAQKTRLGSVPAAPPVAAPPGTSEAGVAPQPRRAGLSPVGIAVGVIVFLVIAVAAVLVVMGRQGSGPLAMMAPPTASATATSTNTPLPPTSAATTAVESGSSSNPTLPPTDTPEPTVPPTEPPTEPPPPTTEAPPALPIIGGADKIAFMNGNDIWAVNVDGTGLVQLTDDGTTKSFLQWAPDGQSVNYISGKCAYSVRLADQQKEILTCFNFVQYFKAFEISPDGKQVATSLDNQMYILPYDLNLLRSITVREDLTRIANCADFAPYLRNFVKQPRWSRDGSEMAMVIMGVARGIGSADTVQVISMKECTPTPDIIDNFPPPRFTPPEYTVAPMLVNFGWDGFRLFPLATYIRNQGFGKLYIYNSDLKKAQGPLNLTGECCYRDPMFSPDGTQLIFAFQKYPSDDTTITLYLIPYGTIGTGMTYTPLPIPAIDPKSAPWPVFRSVK